MGATLHWGTWASHCSGFSCCGTQALGTWASVVALQHVGSSWTRDWTCVSWIGRRILNHCATREVPLYRFLHKGKFSFIWNKHPSAIAETYGSCMFSFIRNCQTFCRVTAPFYVTTNNSWVMHFLHILAHIWCYHYLGASVLGTILAILIGV